MIDINNIFNNIRDNDFLIDRSDQFSVIILLIDDENISVLFERRSAGIPQPNDISLPGGKIDATDKSPLDAVLRETEEELGISRNDILKVKKFGIHVLPSGSLIHIFVGVVSKNTEFNISVDEVQSVHKIPLNCFLNQQPLVFKGRVDVTKPDDFPYHLISTGKDYKFYYGFYNTYFYICDDIVVWGITAYIMHFFLKFVSKE